MRSMAMMAVAVLGALLLAACGEKTQSERAVERAVNEALRKEGRKAKFTMSGGKMTFKDEETGEEVTATATDGKMVIKSKGGEATVTAADDEVVVKSKEGEATMSKGTWRVKSKEGETTFSAGTTATVPKDFPKDVPVYKGAKVLAASTHPGGMGLNLSTQDEPKTVADAYSRDLKAQGWEQAVSNETPDTVVRHFTKGKRSVTVSAAKSGKETGIVIVVQKEEE